MVVWTLDFGWVDVKFWSCERSILVVWTMELVIFGRFIFVGLMDVFSCVDI